MQATMKVTKLLEIEVPSLEQRIKESRLRDHRTITQICGLAGMTTANWYRIESGKQSIPIETLRKMESVLGVNFGVEL